MAQALLQAAVPILAFEAIDSTNAEARRRAEAGETGPLWITAERQSAGRGRRGRPWETGAGNLAATLLLTTSRAPADAAKVSFVAALAVADLATSYVPAERVRLKWPNDVMIAGRKASGILIDSGKRDDGRLWLAIGVGVNLASPPAAAERAATTFADNLRPGLDRPPSPAEALARLSEAFFHWLETWDRRGFEAVRQAWTARAFGLGERCTARLERETLEGLAEGLDGDGAWVMRLDDGSGRRITAGDVFFGAA